MAGKAAFRACMKTNMTGMRLPSGANIPHEMTVRRFETVSKCRSAGDYLYCLSVDMANIACYHYIVTYLTMYHSTARIDRGLAMCGHDANRPSTPNRCASVI